MAQSKSTRSDEFDSIVIGGGLTGLIAAHQLEGTGRKVALVEALDALGGSSRPAATKAGAIDNGLKFFPVTETSAETLAWLSTVLDTEIHSTIVDEPPITYDEGKFKPFIGFGEQKVETNHEISAYAKQQYHQLATTPKDWIAKLTESFTGTVLTQSHVTKMMVDDEFVIEVVLNGAKRISGREILFCASPQQLIRLLPDTHVPAKARQKLTKGELWTSIHLDLIHNGRVTESKAVHVLKGANEEPSVGIFHDPVQLEGGQTAQVSQWLTLAPHDVSDEPEIAASALKQIKRQIKRAYETSLDGLHQERIIVNAVSHGDLTSLLPDDGKWPKLGNLWVISALLDPQKNLLGALQQTRRTLASIAGEPAELIEPDSELGVDTAQPTA